MHIDNLVQDVIINLSNQTAHMKRGKHNGKRQCISDGNRQDHRRIRKGKNPMEKVLERFQIRRI